MVIFYMRLMGLLNDVNKLLFELFLRICRILVVVLMRRDDCNTEIAGFVNVVDRVWKFRHFRCM